MSIPSQGYAQICGKIISHRNPDYKIHPRIFLEMDNDFALTDGFKPYTVLSVSPKILNVRKSPEFGSAIGSVFKGQKINVHGRQGKWVAFKPQSHGLRKLRQGSVYWVHFDYLTFATRGRTTSKDLHSECSIGEMTEHLEDQKINPSCYWVAEYLWGHTNSGGHDYEERLIEQAKSKGFRKTLGRVESNCF